MRFLVFGAGAIGGVVAARLVQGGHEVVAVARGAHAAAMRERGLVLETATSRDVVRFPVVSSAYEVDATGLDAVLLAVKSQDTEDALTSLRAVIAADTPIVCVQNGVDNERAALRLFPHVYGICVMCPTGHLAPGEVQAYSSPVTGIMDIGRYPFGVDEHAVSIADALSRSTFVSATRPDIMRWKYRKLLMNLANAVEALCGAEARDHPIVGAAREEGERCLAAARIDVVSDDDDRQRRGDLMRIQRVVGQRRGGGSTWQSLARATGSVETDHLNGEIVLLGRLASVPTPVNALLQQSMADAASAGTPPGSITADELLARL